MNPFKDDLTSTIPIEIILKIFSYIEGEDVYTLPRVCARWRAICKKLRIKKIELNHIRGNNMQKFYNFLDNFYGINTLGLRFLKSDVNMTDKYYTLKSLFLYCCQVTDVGMTKIAETCSQLQSLNIYTPKEITDVGVTKIAKNCTQLQRLTLFDCYKVTDVGINKIGENCSQLQSLNLRGCYYVTDSGITKIGNGCPKLQELNLLGCYYVTDSGISKIAEGCPQLYYLNLSNCSDVTDVGITKIINGCPQLHTLDIRNCYKLTDGISHVITQLECLEI